MVSNRTVTANDLRSGNYSIQRTKEKLNVSAMHPIEKAFYKALCADMQIAKPKTDEDLQQVLDETKSYRIYETAVPKSRRIKREKNPVCNVVTYHPPPLVSREISAVQRIASGTDDGDDQRWMPSFLTDNPQRAKKDARTGDTEAGNQKVNLCLH